MNKFIHYALLAICLFSVGCKTIDDIVVINSSPNYDPRYYNPPYKPSNDQIHRGDMLLKN